MALPRFYPIFDSTDWLMRMLPLRPGMVQLRIKDKSPGETRAEILRARDLCRAAGVILVVNDYWQIAIDAGCDWVHLGQEDLDGADLGAIRAAGLRLGISTHDEAELERALQLAPDYIALGPIWPTILKAMPWAPQGVERLSLWKEKLGSIPLVAIGGLSIARAPLAFAAGADVVSAVTDITLHPDPEARLAAWLEACG